MLKRMIVQLVWALLMLTAAACSSNAVVTIPASPTATKAVGSATFTDPFAYCAAVGTVDAPDARYTGPQVPDAVINGFKKAASLESSTEPMDMLRKTTIWRCMGDKVYACNFGANLPCDSKANTNKTPTAPMKDFCSANANSEGIPMAVTGHDTIYNWHCANGEPQVLSQSETVDSAGYIAQIWYAISPAP